MPKVLALQILFNVFQDSPPRLLLEKHFQRTANNINALFFLPPRRAARAPEDPGLIPAQRPGLPQRRNSLGDGSGRDARRRPVAQNLAEARLVGTDGELAHPTVFDPIDQRSSEVLVGDGRGHPQTGTIL